MGWLLETVERKFSHNRGNPATVGIVRWPSAGDSAGYRLRRPSLTAVSLISMLLAGGWCLGRAIAPEVGGYTEIANADVLMLVVACAIDFRRS